MTEPATSSMRRDVISAYLASAAKILSWVVVSGIVYRYAGVAEFSVFALIRGTIGILNYTTFGLSPAMIRMIAETRRSNPAPPDDEIGYFNATRSGTQSLYSNGFLIAIICGAIGSAVTLAFASYFTTLFRIPAHLLELVPFLVGAIGCGTILRLMSDAPGSVLQAHGEIARDNLSIVAAEVMWIVLCAIVSLRSTQSNFLFLLAMAYVLSGFSLLLLRDHFASKITGMLLPQWRLIDEKILKRLLSFGSLVLFAQLADYLYAPTDYILINRLLGWVQVAVYTPAMQIDAGLLLLVTGLSSVILPRTALAHAAGEMDRIRRYYVYGTLGSAFLLVFAGIVVFLASPLIFRLWLGDPMEATQAILPFVLVHTLVGGSSAVGRSILLGMGKVKPFTISVLIAGVSNVILSYIFVRYCGLGLRGIVLGTIIAVVGRCAIWMPWYVLRCLKASPQATG